VLGVVIGKIFLKNNIKFDEYNQVYKEKHAEHGSNEDPSWSDQIHSGSFISNIHEKNNKKNSEDSKRQSQANGEGNFQLLITLFKN